MITCNNQELDKIRDDVKRNDTVRENYELRILWLRLWVATLQQKGADLSPFLPVDKIFQDHFYWNLCNSPTGKQKDFTLDEFNEIARGVNQGYTILEKIHKEQGTVNTLPLSDTPLSGKDIWGNGGEEWPLYGGDSSHTASTENHGPVNGKISWKFPVGLAWYSRPLLHEGTVITASPGIRTVLKCHDAQTGRELWRSCQLPDIVGDQLYWSPCHAGTPFLIDDKIYLRDMGARGNEGITKSVSVFRAENGENLGKIEAGHVDYRCGYPPLSGDGRYLALPHAVHDIHLDPPVAHPFNRIKIYDLENEEYIYHINTGHLFDEPVLSDNRVYFADDAGYIYAMEISDDTSIVNRVRTLWRFKADSSMNSGITLTKEVLISGSSDGTVYCLDRETGEVKWQKSVDRTETNSFKQFSRACITDNRVYIGTSGSQIIQFDLKSGDIESIYEGDDWIRSRPHVQNGVIYAASLRGCISLFKVDGPSEPFKIVKVSTHPILSDLEAQGGSLFINDSDLFLSVYDEKMNLKWKTSLIDSYEEEGQRIFVDQIAGGAYYQSKPTVAQGKVFIGSPSRFIFALDEKTGKELWKSEMAGAVSGAPSYYKNRIYAGQQGGEDSFYCLDSESGRKVWTQSLGWVWGSANIKDDRVFVPGIDGYVSCLDADSGYIKWRYRTGKSTCTEPAVDEDRVFFGGWDEILHAFDAETGRILWQYQLEASSDSGAQIARDGKIYVPSGGNRFRCLDNRTGELIWEFHVKDATFNASPACDGENIYISVWDGLGMAGIPIGSWIHKLDMKSGQKIWSLPGGGLTAPVASSDRVYWGSTTSPWFSCASKGTGGGRILWQVSLGGKVEESCTALANYQAFILSSHAFLYAIN